MTWKLIEFCQNYPSRFLFQIKNWLRKETWTYQGRKHLLRKNSSILLTSVSVVCADWLALFLRSDPTTTAARIDRKAVFTKFKPWSQQNPFLSLKIQVSNEIIRFKMRRTDQQTPRRLSLELCKFRFHEIDPSLSVLRVFAWRRSSLNVIGMTWSEIPPVSFLSCYIPL